MPLIDSIQSHLDELARSLSIAPPLLSDTGESAIEINGISLLFQANKAGDNMLMAAPVGELAEGDAQEIITMLLQANLVWDDKQGGHLALDGDGEIIMFNMWITPQTMNFHTFLKTFTRFISLAASWKKTLPQMVPPSALTERNSPASAFLRV